MRQLWIHRDVEILQGMMTKYLYSSRFLTKDRVDITWEWNNIKKEMDEVLREMDAEAASKIERPFISKSGISDEGRHT